MEVRKTIKETEVTEYVAKDGKVFTDAGNCLHYEKELNYEEAHDWLGDNDLTPSIGDDLWSYITHQFPSDDDYEVWFIKVTDEAVEMLDKLNKYKAIWGLPDMETLKGYLLGKVIVLMEDYSGELYMQCTLDALVEALMLDAAQMLELKRKEEN